MRLSDARVRSIMVVSGLLTCTMAYTALAPQAAPPRTEPKRRKPMRITSLLATALLLLATPAVAENAPADDAIIRELLEVTESARLLDSIGAQIDSMMEQSIRDALAGKNVTSEQQALLDELRGRVVTIFRETMSWDVLEPRIIAVYRKTFTHQEVEGMLAFYRTDAGRAVIAKMPLVMQNSFSEMQENIRAMMPKIQEAQQDFLARVRALEQQPAANTT